MRNQLGVWCALALLAAGFFVLVDRLAPAFGLLGRLAVWWPALLILLGVGGALRLAVARSVLRGPFIVTAVGAVLLLITLDPLPDALSPFIVPGVLVLAGVGYLVRLATARPAGERLVARVVSVGVSRHVTWPPGRFSLGTITAIACGCVIDLSQAEPLDGRARLDITAVAGGVDLRVPAGWRVELDKSTTRAVFGRPPEVQPLPGQQESGPVLVVYGLFVLSGLDVGVT